MNPGHYLSHVDARGWLRRLRLLDVVGFVFYIAIWFFVWASGTATGFLLWEKGDFVGGGIKGALAGVVPVIFERLWYASKERRAGRRNL